MDQKTISRVLIAAGALATAAGIFLFFVFGTRAAIECRQSYPEFSRLFWPGLVWLWTIGLIYCAAMAYYFRIVINIGRDRSFIQENARGLIRIAVLMCAAGVLWLGGILALPASPGRLALALAAIASFAMGMLAWALGRLLAHAVQLKEENDLTV